MDNNLLIHRLIRQRERRRSLRLQRRQLRDASNPFELPDARFVELFRFPQFWVLQIIEMIAPFMTARTRRSGIPVQIRVLGALNFYATGSYQRSVGQDYHLGMSQTMMSRAIHEVSAVIEGHLLAVWVKFPLTEMEKSEVKQRFMEKTGFPGVCGAIDCTHVAILPPSEEHNYLNRKGYHSKNVQIIADFDLRILNINARYAGSTHDAFIWRNSGVRDHLMQQFNAGIRGSWLLGDSGYPLEPWLLTPIIDAAAGTPEERYTNRHVRTRVCVERCNGVLKSVFRCLGKDRILRYSPRIAGSIINTCAVLHNMRVHLKMIPVADDIPAEVDEEVQAGDNVVVRSLLDEGRRVRNNVVRYFN